MKKYFILIFLISCSPKVIPDNAEYNYRYFGKNVNEIRREAEKQYSRETGIPISTNRIDAIFDSLTDNRLK